jgi:DNA polymerase III subunit alpha
MPHADFVHLRVHSAYSLSEGAIRVDQIAALAREARMPAVAITDTANLFGALEFSQYCMGKGVQPIIGCQISIARPEKPGLAPDPIVLLAQMPDGLANLQMLSSAGFLDSDPAAPQLDFDTIAARAEGLFLLTGGTRGPLARLLGEGREPDASALLARMREAFGDRLGVELHRHDTKLDRALEPGLITLADRFHVPLVATNECFFDKRAMYVAHDALMCIAESRLLADAERRRVTPEHWFKPADAMRALFADLPDACDNTLAIARSCAVMAETRKPLLPVCPKVRPGSSEEETLRAMAREGLALRMAAKQADAATCARYAERLEYELGVIAAMGFAGYFLIVADFIQWAKSQGIPVGPGRGSGAGSVAAWALTITDLDPLQFNLLFERFLNPERISMPDFDIDFCQERRDEVISYVRSEYGADRVAQIITFGKLQARAAVRDVGRVLAMPYGQVNRVAELIPNNPAKPVTLKEAVAGERKLQDMREGDESVRRLLEIAMQIEGLYRHASTHAAGLVIGDRKLTELVPMYRDPREGTLVTQYNMKYVEQAGLVKFDFLGLTTLTILQKAVGFVRGQGLEVDLERIPLDDEKTYAMLSRGDAGGVFQFESQGMRDVLRQMRPDRLEDLIAAVALYRPGPMANIPAYCQRKHGEAWQPPHEELREILEETYGIMVYQEQVMQIAQKMGGYSLGGADLLRRAMGKKIRSEMDSQRQIFTNGATARGISDAKAVEVFELMAKFADYGFNKSHAAAYALVSYQTAWMKANHPVAFLAACMSLAITNTDKLAALRQEAERLGIRVLPPSINRSQPDFSVERQDNGNFAIRYALAAVKKVGMSAMHAVVQARGHNSFRDLTDFATRVDPRQLNKMQLENLVRAGAFDELDRNRARLFTGAETILRRAQAQAEEAGSGQIGLFGGTEPEKLRLPELPDWPDIERLGYEAEAVGFHLTAHPLDGFSTLLRRMGVVPTNQVQMRAEAGRGRVKLAGCMVSIKERPTKTGNRMAWLTISDTVGACEVTLFSEVLSRVRDLLVPGAPLLVTADVALEGEALRVTAQDVASLDKAAAEAGGAMRVWLRDTASVPHISNILARESRGRGRVFLVPMLEGQEVDIALPGHYAVTPALRQALKMIPGVERVDDA